MRRLRSSYFVALIAVFCLVSAGCLGGGFFSSVQAESDSCIKKFSVQDYITKYGQPSLEETPEYGRGVLNLSRLGLSSLDGLNQISHPEQVKALLLDGNNLCDLTPGVFSEFVNLNTLFLENNQLTMLPSGFFRGLKNLEGLRLEDNYGLSDLPVDLFQDTPKLQFLDLSRNYLCMGHFERVSLPPTLKNLALSENGLSTLPLNLRALKNMEMLYLDGNNCTRVPHGFFDQMQSLEYLDLSSNGLKQLSKICASKLESLLLFNNQLVTLSEDIFQGTPSLKHLYLQDNLIVELPKTVFNGVHLQFLNVANNRIRGTIQQFLARHSYPVPDSDINFSPQKH
jgi:Leucine-rich repeat (LRR) protein